MDGPNLPKDQLDTPALCIDLDKLESNMRAVVTTCQDAGVAWRPHIKCHKSTEIARLQIQAGAHGVTCAKLGEAEVMADGGIPNILIANFIVGRSKCERLAKLCRKTKPIVCVDHIEQLRPLGQAMPSEQPLGVLVEIDVGMHRAGVQPGEPAIELARQVSETEGLRLCGVMGYEGHLLTIADPAEKERRIDQALGQLVRAAQQVRDAGLPCPVVSCGGTGSYQFSTRHPGITEIQAGGAIFMDQFYRTLCHVQGLQHALTVVATVVSCPTSDRAIIDAGRKTMETQVCMPRVLNHPGVEIDYLSAEHGVLRVGADAQPLQIGQRLEIIPGYVDFTTVLHDDFFLVRGEHVVGTWPLEARGRLQ